MTDPAFPLDPNPDEPRIDAPRCAICGGELHEGMAGWQHVDPELDVNHEAVGRDEE